MSNKCKTNRRRLFWSIPFLVAALALIVAGCAPAAPSKGIDQATLRQDWLTSALHTAFYTALDKGYYAQNGIALSVLEGQGSGVTAKAIGTGQDTFGFADAATAMLAMNQGVPIKMIAVVMQKNPFGVVAIKERNINKPKDLEGKTIAINPSGADATMWPLFVKKAGIEQSKVTVVSVESAQMDRIVLDKKVDAVGQMIPGTVVRMETADLPVNVIPYADYGIHRLSSGLLAHTDTLKNKPDLVRRFLKATMMGYDYALKNTPDAVSTIQKYVLKVDATRVLEKMFPKYMEYSHSERTKDKPLGWMAKEDWEDTQNLLFDGGQIKEKKAVDTYYTNEFLPK